MGWKRNKSSWLLKPSEKKEKKDFKEKNVIDTPWEGNINNVVEEHFSLENTETFWYCCQSRMIKYQQPVLKPSKKIEVAKEVVLPEVSKLNDSVSNEQEPQRPNTVFPRKKTLEKRKWVCYYLHIRYLLSHRQTKKQTIYSFNDVQGPGLHKGSPYRKITHKENHF